MKFYLFFIYFLVKYCDIILFHDHFTIKVSPKKILQQRNMKTQKYHPYSSKDKYLKYNIVLILGTKCSFDILLGS